MAEERRGRGAESVLEGELAASANRVLGMALRIAMICVPALLLVTALLRTPQEAAAVAALWAATLGAFALHRAGRPEPALRVLIGALIAYGILGVAVYGSVRGSAVLAFVAAIVVSGIFLHPRFLAWVTAVCVAALGALVYAESLGVLPRPEYATGPHTWVTYSVVLAALGFVTYYGRSLIVAALARAREEAAARQRAQDALRESERLYRDTFDLAATGIAHVDAASDRVLRVNRHMCEMFGRDERDIVGRSMRELSYPDDRGAAEPHLARLRRGEAASVRFEKRYLRGDGETLWATVNVALLRDERGRPLHEVAVFDDVTERRRAEAALRASEEHRRRVFRASPAAMTVNDFDTGLLLDMNEAAEALVGSRREDLVGRSVEHFYADATDRQRLRARLEREQRLVNVPITFRRPVDGAPLETITSVELVRDGDRRVVVSIIVDLTAEVRAREALRRSEERFAKVFFALPVNLAITRRADGRYVEINVPPELALGRTREELLGRTVDEIGIWPEAGDRDRFMAALERDGRLMGYEARLRHKSGEIVDCLIWATPIELDGEACVMTSTVNVTEAKRREALLLEVAQGVAAQIGADFFEQLALHFARALGADAAVVGEITASQRVRSLAVVRDGAALPELAYPLDGSACETALAAGAPRVYPDRVAELFPGQPWLRAFGARGYAGCCLRDADGTPIGVLAAVFREPLEDTAALDPLLRIFAARAQSELQRLRHDRLVEGLNASLEQRVRERTVQLEAAVRELEAFSYSVSHDLRAPLRAIGSFAHLVAEGERGQLSAEGRRRLEVVEANAVRMGQLIDELLQLARVPRVELRREALDLGAIAVPLLETLRTTYPATEVQVDEMPPAQGDATLALQALANLLDNAFKFSQRAAAPRVELGWSVRERAYYVRDNGIGFDMRHAAKLFGTFERLHTEREFPGTGVGLAIVKRIVDRHGGRVWAESQPGAGATFYFDLGLESREERRRAPRSRGSPAGRRPASAT